MRGSLIHRLQGTRVGWRGTLLAYWLKDNGSFLAMMGLPILALGAFAAFAWRDGKNVEAQRQRDADLRCLAENIYFEARGEPPEGQFAVAEVTLNRVASAHFPDTVCDVVRDTRWDPKRRRLVAHFSWTALQLKLGFDPGTAAWKQAQTVAAAVYDGQHKPRVPGALFYHATYVQPYWARGRKPLARIGNHVFYR